MLNLSLTSYFEKEGRCEENVCVTVYWGQSNLKLIAESCNVTLCSKRPIKFVVHTCMLMNVVKTLNTHTVMDLQVTILIWGDIETIGDSCRKLLVQF